ASLTCTLSLHDALPIFIAFPGQRPGPAGRPPKATAARGCRRSHSFWLACSSENSRMARSNVGLSRGREVVRHDYRRPAAEVNRRSEEHTSELQSLAYLV